MSELEMATAVLTPRILEMSGKCLFCLRELKTRSEVKKLDCEHLACSDCLKTELESKLKLKCPECRHVTDSGFHNLEVVSTYEEYTCQSRNCRDEAVTYCSSCLKFFCGKHDEFHSEMIEEHTSNVMEINDYRQQVQILQTNITAKKCTAHRDEYLIACRICLKLLCDGCLEETSSADTCVHQSISIKRGSELAFQKVAAQTRKLQEVDHQLENMLKLARQQTNAFSSRNKDQIHRLKEALQTWHKKLDEIAETLEESINRSTANFELDTRRFEQQINEQLKANQVLEDATCVLSDQHPITILKIYDTQETKLKALQSVDSPSIPQPQPILLEHLKVEIPWKLKQFVPPYYKSLKFDKRIKTKQLCYTVDHLKDGTLIHPTLPVLGMSISTVPGSDVQTMFTLGLNDSERLIHQIDTAGNVSTLVRYPANSNSDIHHLVISKDYIITCDTPTRGLKVFDITNLTHKFDIKLEAISKHPLGIKLLSNNTLVVSDFKNNSVINITIDQNPTIIWHLAVDLPTGIHIDKTTNCILVACGKGNKIYVLSVEGRLIKTLFLPNGEMDVYDLSVYEDQLVLANGAKRMKLFTIKYFTEDLD